MSDNSMPEKRVPVESAVLVRSIPTERHGMHTSGARMPSLMSRMPPLSVRTFEEATPLQQLRCGAVRCSARRSAALSNAVQCRTACAARSVRAHAAPPSKARVAGRNRAVRRRVVRVVCALGGAPADDCMHVASVRCMAGVCCLLTLLYHIDGRFDATLGCGLNARSLPSTKVFS
jgi:hypothetical protein